MCRGITHSGTDSLECEVQQLNQLSNKTALYVDEIPCELLKLKCNR